MDVEIFVLSVFEGSFLRIHKIRNLYIYIGYVLEVLNSIGYTVYCNIDDVHM